MERTKWWASNVDSICAFIVNIKLIAFFLAYLNDLNEWGPIFTLWSNSEDKLKNAINAMAKAIEKSFVALQELVRHNLH